MENLSKEDQVVILLEQINKNLELLLAKICKTKSLLRS